MVVAAGAMSTREKGELRSQLFSVYNDETPNIINRGERGKGGGVWGWL